jgi:uncharacterized repeat protein (TIGR03803 family)
MGDGGLAIERISRAGSVAAVALVVVLGVLCLPDAPLYAQTFTVLHEFTGGTDGQNPQAALVRDGSGNLYGTTPFGGTSDYCGYGGPGCGVVFKIDAGGHETIVHAFTGAPNDGAYPYDSLLVGGDGTLYGTTAAGGEAGTGTVFKITPSGGESILHSFGALDYGTYPLGGLVMDAEGVIYGTTEEGGVGTSCWGACGTVFRIDADGTYTVLVNFEAPSEYPGATLTMDPEGDLYGSTSGNGGCCLGTIFRVAKDAISTATTMHTFMGGAAGSTPIGSLLQDTQGRIYGATTAGGDLNCPLTEGDGCGVLYELSPKGGLMVLHAFAGQADGAIPFGGLVRDKSGNLFGTTSRGGTANFGTVFKLDRRHKMILLHNFENTDGALPYSGLVEDPEGNLYGTTYWGGNFDCNSQTGCGVVFKLAP